MSLSWFFQEIKKIKKKQEYFPNHYTRSALIRKQNQQMTAQKTIEKGICIISCVSTIISNKLIT